MTRLNEDNAGLVLAALHERAMDRAGIAAATGIPYSTLFKVLQRLIHDGKITKYRDIHAPVVTPRKNRWTGAYQAIADHARCPRVLYTILEQVIE